MSVLSHKRLIVMPKKNRGHGDRTHDHQINVLKEEGKRACVAGTDH